MSRTVTKLAAFLTAAAACVVLVAGANAGAAVPSPASLDALHARMTTWLADNELAGFRVAEIMAFSENDYVAVQDAKGKDAFELLVQPASGWVMGEPPSMMWNTKYGMMRGFTGSYGPMGMMGGGMMGGGSPWWYVGQATRVTTVAQAVKVANAWLGRVRPGERAESDGGAFPGYYTLDTVANGKTAGMLSVNARNGAVWYHGWHGRFLTEREY